MPTTLFNTNTDGSQRVFAYARVSTVEQMTENQREQIARAGYNIRPKFFIEEQVSGSVPTAQRQGFQRLMERMDEGDTLVVTKLDRIGRDAIDVVQTVDRFQRDGIRVVVLQLGNLDLTSPAGALMVKLLAAVADFERDLIIERTQAGQARARAAGRHMGRPSKTTHEQKSAIRSSLAAGATVSSVAATYGVSRATIIAIRETGR